MKRHLAWSMDFDTRANVLGVEINDDWEESAKELHRQNKANIISRLSAEFGSYDIDRKVNDFIALGAKPFSIIAHHNILFEQVRAAFVLGAYYPALTGACALGERILNHLVIDLRHEFKKTPEYKRVHRKESFDNWQAAIAVLEAWGILETSVAELFRSLEKQRQRAIHFNPAITTNLRDEALVAAHLTRDIVENLFGTFAKHPWRIEGTKGHSFIKESYESDPFLRHYYLSQYPLVGYRFAIRFGPTGPLFFDFNDYGDGALTDEEFRDLYNNRNPSQLAPTDLPSSDGDSIASETSA